MCNIRTDILDNGARDSFHYEGKYKYSKHPLAISIHPGCHRHKKWAVGRNQKITSLYGTKPIKLTMPLIKRWHYAHQQATEKIWHGTTKSSHNSITNKKINDSAQQWHSYS